MASALAELVIGATEIVIRRMDSNLSVSRLVAQQVRRLPKGQVFSIRRFAAMGTKSAVSKACARLVSAGELERVYPGIYMRPKRSQYTGWVRPSVLDLVNLIAKQNRWTLQIHGANAIRGFGLSTQMPLIPIYYTSGPSKSLFVANAEVRLVHASPMMMQHPGTRVGMAICALLYLGKMGSSPDCVAKIKGALSSAELVMLMACRMPKWMREALGSASAYCSGK